jgi:hypothetical protein
LYIPCTQRDVPEERTLPSGAGRFCEGAVAVGGLAVVAMDQVADGFEDRADERSGFHSPIAHCRMARGGGGGGADGWRGG